MSLAVVFPGQGSQSVGMLAALAAAEPLVQATFAEASGVLGYDLWQLVEQGPEGLLNATERTQPAMLAAGVAVWRVWQSRAAAQPHRLGHDAVERGFRGIDRRGDAKPDGSAYRQRRRGEIAQPFRRESRRQSRLSEQEQRY